MRYIEEFRDGRVARALAAQIAASAAPGRLYRFMEFCGGHTHAIFRYGIQDLLPPGVQMVHGPGCPVCVLPIGRVDMAVELARRPGVVLCTYGDMLRVPGSGRMSLLRARADGADVRMVQSCLEAVSIAQEEPGREVVFFAIGFETTTPPTAVAVLRAAATGLVNFSVFCNHVLTPPAIQAILDSPEAGTSASVAIDGFVGPAHVSTIIGTIPYERFASEYRRPVVIAGFEPLDVMRAILMLVSFVNDSRFEVGNEYTRVVTREGNLKAQALMTEVFELRESFEWRGLGSIPQSAVRIREEYVRFDAERRFSLPEVRVADEGACECGSILRGLKRPTDCPLFGTVCTPESPVGSCMVSSEGACAAYYLYGRFRQE